MFISIEKFSKKEKIALSIWILVALFCAIQSLITYRYNNYLIFENSFRNLLCQQSLYAPYPLFHFDTNHYGPIFSLFFMPFALLPNAIGLLLWGLFNVLILFKAIDTLPLKNKLPIYLIAIPCVVSAALSEQFNPITGAFIVLSYTLLNKDKGIWSTMLIALGTFIKLYGIVGLAFFFFVADKKRFIAYLIMWSVFFFILPMFFSSPSFIFSSYSDWLISLINKNASNVLANSQDISIMGLTRDFFDNHEIPNSFFLLTGIILFALPYFNFKAFSLQKFQLLILASTLMFPVLFSTGSEDCTYIVAILGVGIWYILIKKKVWKPYLLGITILFSCNFPLLLFPHISTQYPILFTILSLPFFIIWLLTVYKANSMPSSEEVVM